MTLRGSFPGRQGGAESAAILARREFFALMETPCPYLPGRRERKLVTPLKALDATELYSRLSRAGFRRSHNFAYRPACRRCQACVPVRVVAERFLPSRSQRRVLRRNVRLTAEETPARATREQFTVFKRYVTSRHSDGDMATMSYREYCAMVEETRLDTRLTEFREAEGRLVAACLVDWLDDGVSAVYSYFDPDLAHRSPGSFMVMWLIEATRRRELPYVYLGYWLRDVRKMHYKKQFRPLEALGPSGWTPLAP